MVQIQAMTYEQALTYVPESFKPEVPADAQDKDPETILQPRFSAVQLEKVLKKSLPPRKRFMGNSHGKRGRK